MSRDAMHHHVRSEEELIIAVLRRRDEVLRSVIMREVERRAPDPRGRLLALFDFLGTWLRRKDFAGCTFIDAVAEFHDPDHPAHRAATEHKRLMLECVERLRRAAGAGDPGTLARQIAMLFDGAIVQAHADGPSPERVPAARAGAAALIDAALIDAAMRGGARAAL